MALDPRLRERLVLPAFCAPMYLVSGKSLLAAACKAGIIAGTNPRNWPSVQAFEHDMLALRRELDEFQAEHPQARIQFFNSSLATLWDDLRHSDIDLALTLASVIPLDIAARDLGHEVLGPVCARDHRLAQMPQPLPMRAFQSERQIYYVGSPQIDMERVGRTFSTDIWTVNDVESIKSMVAGGLGWCFSATRTFEEGIERGEIVRLACRDMQMHPVRTVVAAWPKHRHPGLLGQDLLAALTGQTRR